MNKSVALPGCLVRVIARGPIDADGGCWIAVSSFAVGSHAHLRNRRTQRAQCGFSSSHLTLRLRQGTQPARR